MTISQNNNQLAGSNFFWTASHAVGGAAFASSASRSQTPSFLKSTGESEPIVAGGQQLGRATPTPAPQQHQQPAQQQTEALNDAKIGGSDGSAKVQPCDECGATIA